MENRVQPIPEFSYKEVVTGSGFRMEGYFVWCGSVIKEGDTYYMFASRWKKENSFPSGYMTNSEIVMATTTDLSKPFVYQKQIIGKRAENYWDSMMAHNPFILKLDQGYCLYYIGTPDGKKETRAIGYAYAESLNGEWKRCDKPLVLPADANNPCVIKDEKGKYLLYFRDGDLKVSVARSDRYDGPFEVISDNLFPEGRIEDMYVYRTDSGFEMLAEDAGGVYTGLKKGGVWFCSKDGISWDRRKAVQAYDFEVIYDDKSVQQLQRRERPILFKDGERTYLFTGAKISGETTLTGGDTWNLVQELAV